MVFALNAGKEMGTIVSVPTKYASLLSSNTTIQTLSTPRVPKSTLVANSTMNAFPHLTIASGGVKYKWGSNLPPGALLALVINMF